MTEAADVREHQFRHLDLSKTAPGEWIEIRADAAIPGGITRKNHLVACVAATESVAYMRADDAPVEGRPHTFVLARVGRSDSLVQKAWVCTLGGEFRAARIQSGGRKTDAAAGVATPDLSVLAQKKRHLRTPDPPVTGRVYAVEATVAAYEIELKVSAVSAFSSELPFPLRTSDPELRARAFLPAAWTEFTLEPASPVFLRTRQQGMSLSWRVVRWGRNESALVKWGEAAKARVEKA
jgi:hypothetical protein